MSAVSLVGRTFTHHSLLDPDWRPDAAAGEKWADGPKVVLEVTRVTQTTVWAASVRAVRNPRARVRIRFDRARFLAEYGTALGWPTTP